MISVRYIAPLMRPEAHEAHACYLDLYAMLLPRQSSMPYVVEVEHDNQQTGLREGDQLIVDEKRIPRAGDIGIYGAGGALYACQIFESKGTFCPIDHEKLSREHQVVFGGVVTAVVKVLFPLF